MFFSKLRKKKLALLNQLVYVNQSQGMSHQSEQEH